MLQVHPENCSCQFTICSHHNMLKNMFQNCSLHSDAKGGEGREHLLQRPTLLDIHPQMSANNQSKINREMCALLHDCVHAG